LNLVSFRMRSRRIYRGIGYLILVTFLLAGCAPGQGEGSFSARISGMQDQGTASGFRRAEGVKALQFPEDFGPHPGYQTEWWYYTGNLDSADGRHFGYQLTFFRRALKPAAEVAARSSNWATNQVYMAHLALTDVQGGQQYAYERLARGAAGLAGAQANPYQVWLEDWRVEQSRPGVYQLQASQDGMAVELELVDQKGPVLQGDQGYSKKGPEPGQASYYYSQTRLVSNGSVQVGGERFEVQGLSWMDHEYSTSSLAADQVGWDWFALQLEDGRDLMLYNIRKADGSLDAYSSGTVIDAAGVKQNLTVDDFEIQVQGTWKSPHTQAVYPSGWRIQIPSQKLDLEVTPYLDDQELNLSYSYWEGAVRISGRAGDQTISGVGYVELTGYAASMGGEF
jgi:predicted secreted hydrolase